MMNEIFLDTAFALALANRNDLLHAEAMQLADRLETEGTSLITSRAVLLKIGNSFAKLRYRPAGSRLLAALEADPNVEIVPLTEALFSRALQLYGERLDKEWGLTDCISFVIMTDRGITAALTPDKHFAQAGYHALLRTVE